jgi:hypothetical protein
MLKRILERHSKRTKTTENAKEREAVRTAERMLK